MNHFDAALILLCAEYNRFHLISTIASMQKGIFDVRNDHTSNTQRETKVFRYIFDKYGALR